VGTPGDGFARRAVSSPFVEHVGVLYAPTGLEEARAWLDQSFARAPSDGPVAAIGPAILLALFGVVLLARGLSRQLPEGPAPHQGRHGTVPFARDASGHRHAAVLAPFDTRFLPVLVADYLALHLAIYGALTLALAAWAGAWPRAQGWVWGLALAAYGLIAFGGILDRYVASFVPVAGPDSDHGGHPARGDPRHAGRCGPAGGRSRPALARWAARLLFLASLGLAVALDFERLFFLLIILPVILLFYLSFGLMGRRGWAGARARWWRWVSASA
jgi:hypothetical protein